MTTAAQNFSAPGSRNVLIASSNQLRRQRWIESLHRASWPTREACGGADALSQLESSGGCRLLLLDQKLPDLDTQELVGIIESRFPSTDVVLLDAETGRAQLPLELRSSPLYRTLASFESEEEPGSSSPPIARRQCSPWSPYRIAPVAAMPVRNSEPERGAEPLAGMVGASPVMRRLYRLVRLGGASRHHRTHHGRKRDRQGVGCRSAASAQPASGAPIRDRKLRRNPGNAA